MGHRHEIIVRTGLPGAGVDLTFTRQGVEVYGFADGCATPTETIPWERVDEIRAQLAQKGGPTEEPPAALKPGDTVPVSDWMGKPASGTVKIVRGDQVLVECAGLTMWHSAQELQSKGKRKAVQR